MSSEIREYMIKGFEGARHRFLADIEALGHDELDHVWGDGCRRAYDVIYEVGVMNRRGACETLDTDPGPFLWKFGEEWLQAPAEMRTKEAAIQFTEQTSQELLDAVAKSGKDDVTVVKALAFASTHTNYHDAQLNFIQAMKGDLAVHW